jgi:hypothetical protein
MSRLPLKPPRHKMLRQSQTLQPLAVASDRQEPPTLDMPSSKRYKSSTGTIPFTVDPFNRVDSISTRAASTSAKPFRNSSTHLSKTSHRSTDCSTCAIRENSWYVLIFVVRFAIVFRLSFEIC